MNSEWEDRQPERGAGQQVGGAACQSSGLCGRWLQADRQLAGSRQGAACSIRGAPIVPCGSSVLHGRQQLQQEQQHHHRRRDHHSLVLLGHITPSLLAAKAAELPLSIVHVRPLVVQ